MSLFIGGSKDGERIALEREMPDVRFPVLPKMSFTAFDLGRPQDATQVEIDQYIRKPWRNGEIIRYVYFHDSIREEETLDRMIDGYREPNQKELKDELARCKEELRHYRAMFAKD